MRQVISSAWTLFFKVLVPAKFVTLSIFLLLILSYFPTQARLDALMVTIMAVAATVFFCWWGVRLKRVSVDEYNLYVAGLRKEISIPLTGIYSINAVQGGWPVIVRLKEKSEFGHTILVLAKWRPILFGSSHPILHELRQLISNRQNS
jgi:uncharacterized membrane protein YqjE